MVEEMEVPMEVSGPVTKVEENPDTEASEELKALKASDAWWTMDDVCAFMTMPQHGADPSSNNDRFKDTWK
jgi:hypothetical protein